MFCRMPGDLTIFCSRFCYFARLRVNMNTICLTTGIITLQDYVHPSGLHWMDRNVYVLFYIRNLQIT